MTGTPQAALDARYGRTPGRAKRDRRILWIVAAAFVAVFAAWVVWAGLDGSGPTIETRDTAHELVDATTVSVSFEVTAPPNTPLACAVKALNEQFAVIGWKVIELPVSAERTRNFTETVRTTEQSNTGLVSECWVLTKDS
ncbi:MULTISPECIES: DUF4307 domain-containing protein [unclassified Plantibacter]|jgi:hypothetical protein|uniref:DUF4307 domain-containing protein n=1 Tax=unclassified Plantibacter TaxID=2624265 RepID=UPI003D34A2DD